MAQMKQCPQCGNYVAADRTYCMNCGITLGIRHMFDCRRTVLQISGRHKAEITEKLLRTAPTEDIPATVLKLLPNGTVVLDRDAAALCLDLLEE